MSPARTAEATEKPVGEPSADAGEAGAFGWGGACGDPGVLAWRTGRTPSEAVAGAVRSGGASEAPSPAIATRGMAPRGAGVRAAVAEATCTDAFVCA